MTHEEKAMIKEILERLVRTEARLSQLMLHFGLDPSIRLYDSPRRVGLEDEDNRLMVKAHK